MKLRVSEIHNSFASFLLLIPFSQGLWVLSYDFKILVSFLYLSRSLKEEFMSNKPISYLLNFSY